MLSLNSGHWNRSALEKKINFVHMNSPTGTPSKDVSLVRVVQGWDEDQRNNLLGRLVGHCERGIAVHVFLVGEDLNWVDTHTWSQVKEFNFCIRGASIVLWIHLYNCGWCPFCLRCLNRLKLFWICVKFKLNHFVFCSLSWKELICRFLIFKNQLSEALRIPNWIVWATNRLKNWNTEVVKVPDFYFPWIILRHQNLPLWLLQSQARDNRPCMGPLQNTRNLKFTHINCS